MVVVKPLTIVGPPCGDCFAMINTTWHVPCELKPWRTHSSMHLGMRMLMNMRVCMRVRPFVLRAGCGCMSGKMVLKKKRGSNFFAGEHKINVPRVIVSVAGCFNNLLAPRVHPGINTSHGWPEGLRSQFSLAQCVRESFFFFQNVCFVSHGFFFPIWRLCIIFHFACRISFAGNIPEVIKICPANAKHLLEPADFLAKTTQTKSCLCSFEDSVTT